MTSKSIMTPSTSIYLECTRVFATLLVYIAHSALFFGPLEEFNESLKMGRDGVIIFFVLSGFVITWCANERDKTLTEFAINRASRIYSVAIPGIIIGAAASIFISAYQGQDLSYPFQKPWLYIPVYLTFIGNFWGLSEVPPMNFPYWSLNFEVWYYIIFAGFFYTRGMLSLIVGVGLLLLVGPSLIMLFPLWVAGSLLYYFSDRVKLPRKFARAIVAITIIAFVAAKLAGADSVADQYNAAFLNFFGGGHADQLLGDYLLGVLVFINFYAALQAEFRFGARASKTIKYVASFSFSFYLFHVPVFGVLHVLIPSTSSLLVYSAILVFSTLTIAFFAKHTEHKKHIYRSIFTTISNKLFHPGVRGLDKTAHKKS